MQKLKYISEHFVEEKTAGPEFIVLQRSDMVAYLASSP